MSGPAVSDQLQPVSVTDLTPTQIRAARLTLAELALRTSDPPAALRLVLAVLGLETP